MAKELASKWTEQAKALNLPEAEVIRIRQSMLDKGELENDLPTVAAVTPVAFKDVLLAIKQSAQAVADAAAPAPAPAKPAAKPAPAADFFGDEEVAALRQELALHIERSQKQAEAQGRAQLALANLLEVVTDKLAGLSEQVASSQRATTDKLVTIEQSMRKPQAPKTAPGEVTGKFAPVPSPNDEPPALSAERASFDKDLKAAIQIAQSAVLNGETAEKKANARARIRALSSAAAAASTYNGDFAVLRSRYGLQGQSSTPAV